jgi:hypothetical protein
MDAEQISLVAAVAGVGVGDDGDDRLAGQVARQERDVRLVDVEADGVDELAPGLLGSVQIRGDVEARGDGESLPADVSPAEAR